MKVLLTPLLILFSAFMQAKVLPDIDIIQERLDDAKVTQKEKWESYEGGIKQNLKEGIIFITHDNLSIMKGVSGADQ